MSFPKVNPVTTKAWAELTKHFAEIKDSNIQQFFADDARRTQDFSITFSDFYLDYSKNRINSKTRNLLLQLADEVGLKAAIEAQFSGEKVNETEDRAVRHTDLRNFEQLPKEVKQTLKKMRVFSKRIIDKSRKGYTGKPITDIVNIGVGGSDLGPDMVTEALGYYKNHLRAHFISNVDGDHVREVLKNID